MKLNRPVAALLCALLLPVLAACGSDNKSGAQVGSSKKLQKVTLTLNWYPYGEHAPFFYGIKKGIFAKHGIDLKVDAGQGSGKTVAAVGAGQTDFGWADTPALMAAVDKGLPAKSVGVFLQTTPASVEFFSSKGIKTPADLKGKSIATTAGDALSKTFPAFLKANGLSLGDVTLQATDGAGKIAAVLSGRTDALLGFAHDQGPTMAAKSGKSISYLRFSDFGVEFLSNGLVASNKTIQQRSDLVREMVAATSEAFSAAIDEPTAAVASMKGVNPQLPVEKVLLESWQATTKLLHTSRTTGKSPGVDAEEDWKHTIEVFRTAGTLNKAHQPADFWSSSFAPGK